VVIAAADAAGRSDRERGHDMAEREVRFHMEPFRDSA
jgi:hypothetical protein